MRATETNISTDVLSVLQNAVVTETAVKLIQQMSRPLYVQTNEVLERLGGKWSKKEKCHLFETDDDVRGLIAEALDTKEVPRREKVNLDAFFATPEALAWRLVADAIKGAVVSSTFCEPSCGDGAFLKAMQTAGIPSLYTVAIEKNEGRAALCRDKGYNVICGDFIEYAERKERTFHRIVMNPPFAIPGDSKAYITHFNAAWSLLNPGGAIHGIMPSSIRYGTDKRTAALRELIEQHGELESLPDGTFKKSGTLVSTCYAILRKP